MDKGIARLVGIADEAMVAKSYNVTSGMAEKVGARAPRLRKEADRREQERRAAGQDALADLRQAGRGVGLAWTRARGGMDKRFPGDE
jgi:S-DNA-T family DNA segregation ATPase FtsK/SpoIIIE